MYRSDGQIDPAHPDAKYVNKPHSPTPPPKGIRYLPMFQNIWKTAPPAKGGGGGGSGGGW